MSTQHRYRIVPEYPHLVHYSELGDPPLTRNDLRHPDDKVPDNTLMRDLTPKMHQDIEDWHGALENAARMVVSGETAPTCTLTPEDVYECEGGGPRS